MTVRSGRNRRRGNGVARQPGFVCVASLALLLQGCVCSPSTNVLGAYYPAWLFCIVGAVVGVVVIRVLLVRAKLDDWLDPPAVVYPSLVALLALAGWLLFF